MPRTALGPSAIAALPKDISLAIAFMPSFAAHLAIGSERMRLANCGGADLEVQAGGIALRPLGYIHMPYNIVPKIFLKIMALVWLDGAHHRQAVALIRRRWLRDVPRSRLDKEGVVYQHAVFDPEITRAMGEAFDRVCQSMRDRGQPLIVNEIIAQQVIKIAQAGERDPDRLSEQVLLALGLTRIDGAA